MKQTLRLTGAGTSAGILLVTCTRTLPRLRSTNVVSGGPSRHGSVANCEKKIYFHFYCFCIFTLQIFLVHNTVLEVNCMSMSICIFFEQT